MTVAADTAAVHDSQHGDCTVASSAPSAYLVRMLYGALGRGPQLL